MPGAAPDRIPFLSLQRTKKIKIKIWDRTQKHYLPYEERKGQFILLSLKRKREKNIKNTNTLNMDVACEAIDGLALLYLLTFIVYPGYIQLSEFE